MSSSACSFSIPACCALSASICRRSPTRSGSRSTQEFSSLQQARDAYEREYIQKKIEEARNNISHAAELLGLERSHLYRKMKALGIAARE